MNCEGNSEKVGLTLPITYQQHTDHIPTAFADHILCQPDQLVRYSSWSHCLVVCFCLQSYVALAKGGLVSDHVLICPVAHFESTVKLAEVSRQLTTQALHHHVTVMVIALWNYANHFSRFTGCPNGNGEVSFDKFNATEQVWWKLILFCNLFQMLCPWYNVPKI